MWTRESDLSEDLAEECSAFLAGHYAELLNPRHRLLPPWVMINLPAHGTAAELHDVAHAAAVDGQPNWVRARAFLCGEVLNTVERTGQSLRDVQSNVLVPLESVLERNTDRRQFRTHPQRLVADVLDALEDHRASVCARNRRTGTGRAR